MPRKQKKYHYLYKTTNLINYKFYVGMHSTDDLEDTYLGSGKYLWNSINKHGRENFKREILEFFDTREILIMEEQKFVDAELIKNPLCMNLKIGGGSIGTSDEARLKISQARKGIKLSEETRKKMSQPRTEKHKRNMRLASKHLSIPRTEECKEKLRLLNTGKNHLEHTKEKMTDSQTNRWKNITTEQKENYMRGIRNLTTEQHSEKMKKGWVTRHENKDVLIMQYTKSDEFVKSWICIKDITSALDFHHTNISACCSGRRKYAYGFKWKLVNKEQTVLG